MKCKNCGYVIRGNMSYCPHCGAEINHNNVVRKQKPKVKTKNVYHLSNDQRLYKTYQITSLSLFCSAFLFAIIAIILLTTIDAGGGFPPGGVFAIISDILIIPYIVFSILLLVITNKNHNLILWKFQFILSIISICSFGVTIIFAIIIVVIAQPSIQPHMALSVIGSIFSNIFAIASIIQIVISSIVIHKVNHLFRKER